MSFEAQEKVIVKSTGEKGTVVKNFYGKTVAIKINNAIKHFREEELEYDLKAYIAFH
ncbi:MAG: hypothetical protein JWN56_2781 [Sphingobacteriales bacterium]|nr:hypothetical protein [Sphingobacteriales bacterium]